MVKTECVRGLVFATRAEVNLALLEYIDGFYHSRRIQKRIDYLSPIEFEENHYADEATTEPVPSRRSDVCAGHERMRATRRTNPRHQPLRGCAATSRAVRGASAYRGPRSERELEGSGVSRGHRGVGSHHQHQRVREVGVDAHRCWISPVWREASRPVLQKTYIQHPNRTSEKLRHSLGIPLERDWFFRWAMPCSTRIRREECALRCRSYISSYQSGAFFLNLGRGGVTTRPPV
ncbi:IS3 family transposase [Streptomyces sp. NPDC006700]|uniref:IS3 family transposase n=1 Tax=unclassified Streptomyces TaxID=2593676 RepID=UPI0033CB1499